MEFKWNIDIHQSVMTFENAVDSLSSKKTSFDFAVCCRYIYSEHSYYLRWKYHIVPSSGTLLATWKASLQLRFIWAPEAY